MTPMPKDLLQSKGLTNKFESKAAKRVIPTTMTTPEYNRLPTIDSSVIHENPATITKPKISEITKVAKVKVHTKSNLSFQEPKKKHSAKLDKSKRNGHHDKLNQSQNLSFMSSTQKNKKGLSNLISSPYLDDSLLKHKANGTMHGSAKHHNMDRRRSDDLDQFSSQLMRLLTEVEAVKLDKSKRKNS